MDSECGGARIGIAENDKATHSSKKLLSNTTVCAVFNINSHPPCFGSGLFVLPCKCISLKHVISTFVAPTRYRRISNFSPAFYSIRNEALLPSWQFSLLCLLFSLLLVFVHRNNLSFLFYFIANFAWQRGRCWLCRECYVKGNFCNEFN